MLCNKFIRRTLSNVAREGRVLLYKRDDSPPSAAVMMAAHLLRLPLRYQELTLLRMEHKTPEFLKMNPMGLIPVIKDGDFVLTESHAIIKYLVTKYGGTENESLYPADLETRAVVDQCLFFDTGMFFIGIRNVSLATIAKGKKSPNDQDRARLNESYRVVEAYLSRRQYVAADHLTIADLSVGSTAAAAQVIHRTDPDKYPLLTEYMARLQQEECFREINNKMAEKFSHLLNTFWEKNKQEA